MPGSTICHMASSAFTAAEPRVSFVARSVPDPCDMVSVVLHPVRAVAMIAKPKDEARPMSQAPTAPGPSHFSRRRALGHADLSFTYPQPRTP